MGEELHFCLVLGRTSYRFFIIFDVYYDIVPSLLFLFGYRKTDVSTYIGACHLNFRSFQLYG